MAGIKEAIVDILTQLALIPVTNADSQSTTLHARIWNNQVNDIKSGEGYEWPRPAAFVEIISPVSFEIIGVGFRSADIGIKIHLVHDYYNADGTFEQDVKIFDLRDKVIMAMSGYCPTACGPLNCISEFQEYNHDNLYHYICEFLCNLTDSKGSIYDPNAGKIIESVNPDLDATPTAEYYIPQ